MTNLIAIDPGSSGGFAFILDGQVGCEPMPATDGDVLDVLRSWKAQGINDAVVEQVVGFIPSAGAGAMFTFGEGFGFLKGVLMALGYRVTMVRPKKWQTALSLGAKKDRPGSAWKNHLKGEAQRRFPQCVVTLKTADALLILDYARSTPN